MYSLIKVSGFAKNECTNLIFVRMFYNGSQLKYNFSLVPDRGFKAKLCRTNTIGFKINEILREWKSDTPFANQTISINCINATATKGLQNKNIHLSSITNLPKQYPSNAKDLQKRFTKLQSQKQFDSALSSKLIEAYVNEGRIEEANKVITSTRKIYKNFIVDPMVIKWYVDSCIKNALVKKAQEFIHEEVTMGTSTKIFGSTLIDLCIAMAEHGWHEDALKLLRGTTPEKILTLRKGWSSDSSRLLAYYVEKEDSLRLQGDVQIHVTRGKGSIGGR